MNEAERKALVDEIVKIRRCPVPVAIADSAMMVDKYRAEIIANLFERLIAEKLADKAHEIKEL